MLRIKNPSGPGIHEKKNLIYPSNHNNKLILKLNCFDLKKRNFNCFMMDENNAPLQLN